MLDDPAVFRNQLLAWYQKQARPLPWRTRPSLYKTVLSEFMLQQTRVETVLPYFHRWLQAFPDFEALAAAPESSVLHQWQGLGYYARARNLHRLAQSLAQHGIPQKPADWRALPGIGPYTAAAITSITFGSPEPVIDGNVIRVLARLTDFRTTIDSQASARRHFEPIARHLIDPRQPGDFNQAVMELGATVCRKHQPACLLCPVRQHCAAYRAGTAESLPKLQPKSTSRHIVPRLFLLRQNRILLHTYPPDAPRMAGFAELPALPQPPPPPDSPILQRSRSISSQRIREPVFALPANHPLAKAVLAAANSAWHPTDQLPALSGPHKRWILHLLAHHA